jgi:hypothetical protein
LEKCYKCESDNLTRTNSKRTISMDDIYIDHFYKCNDCGHSGSVCQWEATPEPKFKNELESTK